MSGTNVHPADSHHTSLLITMVRVATLMILNPTTANHNFNEIAPIAVFTHAIICEKIQFPTIYGTRLLKKDS